MPGPKRAVSVGSPEPGQEPDGGPTSGAEADAIDGEHMRPLLADVGGSQAWVSNESMVVIAPSDEGWDAVFAIRCPSRRAFLDIARSERYRATVHHRTTAGADSRLMLTEVDED